MPPDKKKVLCTGGPFDGQTIELSPPYMKHLKVVTSVFNSKDHTITYETHTYEAAWMTPDCDTYYWLRVE